MLSKKCKATAITTWGESHGPAIGCIIDGCPPNIQIRAQDIQKELNKRRPGQKDGLVSGEKCKNSLLVPFIIGTEPNTIPSVRYKCASKPKRNQSDVMQKLKKVFEEGQG